ncbi:MAG: insulinase family protein [Candidatus Cellulosilyticum pullistercoris]|uniref:Insulinase family protein n=1 Tax=Candidatus Cellulosilyticum pullistercoris TaxID=2838521 RepID=A0A9E2KC29_9FIRM|nr:insulinase family protein [Candidatus Cellulosilyticum pullistercoris]
MHLIKREESFEGFRLIEEKVIDEIDGIGRRFYHEKSGVTVITLENNDPHKVFSINFLTLPKDDKGTAHIVEHAVCCASKKYPLKETFTALGQGSICTTMNACTYPDRTMYYAASPHEKDLMGIAEVYLDLVFNPCLTEESQYFLQEGWHFSLEALDAPLELSGVVYHEMLGEYSEASSYLQYFEMKTLFPDTVYQYDSGGLPEAITTLSESEFLDFYHHHYKGSNAVITLYGDGNVKEMLKMMNRVCLQEIEKGEKLKPIPLQAPFDVPKHKVAYYPSSLKKSPTLFSLSFVVGESTNCEMRLAFEILEHVLIRSTASPLLKSLVMVHNLGMSFSEGGYDSCRQQPVFSITLKGCKKEDAEQFEMLTLEVLKKLAKEGIDPALLDAAIETLEFELRETDASYEPIGILYSEMILSSYLYGGDAFNHLSYKAALEHIKANKNHRYFEQMIETYFLQNTHRVLTVLMPSEALQQEKEKKKMKYLSEYKKGLSESELQELVKLNKRLEEEQLNENDEVLLRKLPYLTLEDMPKQLPQLFLEKMTLADCELMIHEEETKDIIYIHFLWDANSIDKDFIKDLGLLAHIFTYVGTKTKSYSELENAINTYTGGITSAIHAYQVEGETRFSPIFKVSCKVLCHQLGHFIEIMEDILHHTQFTEREKLKELIGHMVYEFERSFTGAPEYRASQRIYTYLSEQGAYEDEVAGISFYHYIEDIYKCFDVQYEEIIGRLQKVFHQLIQKQNLKICVTTPHKQRKKVLNSLESLIRRLPHQDVVSPKHYEISLNVANEGFYNGQDVQAVAQGICFSHYGYEYRGQFEVVANILENTYLWDRVRLQGGAYGCDIMISREGYLVVCSYCDPHLETTLEIYGGMSHYLKQVKLGKDTIERAIISTLGAMIAPSSMEQKSERACMYFITKMTQDKRQKIYDEIRETTLKDFREMGEIFEIMASKGPICVIGNKEKLNLQKERFQLIDLRI